MSAHFDPVLFWNTLFDKGLITCVVLVAGLVANKYLERFRSDVAIATEGAKLRLSRIGEIWEELNLWEADSKSQFIEFCNAAVRELQAANVSGVPSAEEAGDEYASSILLRLGAIQIPPVVFEHLERDVLPRSQELAARGRELRRKIHRYRFWLKDELYESLSRYHLQLQKAAVAIELTPEGLKASREAFRALDAFRNDVDEVVNRLLSGAHERASKAKSLPPAT